MKISLLSLLGAALLLSLPLHAQPNRGGDTFFETLKQRLNLTPDQTVKVEAITDSFRTRVRTLRQDAGDDRGAFFQIMQEERDAMNTKIDAVLNDSQRVVFGTIKDEMRERMQNRRGNAGGGGRRW